MLAPNLTRQLGDIIARVNETCACGHPAFAHSDPSAYSHTEDRPCSVPISWCACIALTCGRTAPPYDAKRAIPLVASAMLGPKRRGWP